MPNFVAGIGPLNPKLLICGEAPGKYEDEQGQPFVGPTGKMLDNYLYKAGISRNECYITNVIKYRPPLNDIKKLHLIDVDLNQCIKELWDNEIKILHPNCILAVGDLALQATTGLSGILNQRGSILRGIDGTKVIPTIHPAALFSRYGSSDEQSGGLDYVYSKLIQHDIIRAVEESNTSGVNTPQRELNVIHNSLDLYRYFRSYENLHRASCDIESINCIPVCIGFATNRHHAISVPLLSSINKHKLTDMSDGELDECWRIIDIQLRRLKLVGHNFKYDEFKLSRMGFECPAVFSDTLIKTRVLFPELPDKRLSTVASLWTREPYYKEEGKEFKIGKSPVSQLFLYNAKDCAVTFEIDEAQELDLIEMGQQYNVPLKEYYYNYQMKKHKFYLEMENNGFRIDFNKKKQLTIQYQQMQEATHAQLTELVGHDVNVQSPPQVFSLLYKEMRLPSRKNQPTGEDTIIALMSSHCKGSNSHEKKLILETLLQERRIRNQRSRYINFEPDYDGRCRTSFNIIATETCRSSTSVIKKPLRPKKLGLAFHTISKHGELAKSIRSMFIPDPGKVLIQVDSSQAEARVVAVLSKDWELLEAFDKIDIHRRTAGLLFGYLKHLDLSVGDLGVVDHIDKDSPERFTGKKVRHAGGYDMKKHRLMTEFNTDAQKFNIKMEISEWKAGQLLDLFHEASPKIRNTFHAEIKAVLIETKTLIDPFGGIRVFNGRDDEDLYKEGFANIPQRTVGHLVQGAALKTIEEAGDDIVPLWTHKPGANWISENHDSLLMQAPENNWEKYARLLQKHMQEPIDFSRYCSLKRDVKLIIPCDIEISDTNYSEMRKVKL